MSETVVESLSVEMVLCLGTIAIYIYDYVRTLPAEYKFWRDKGPQIRPPNCLVLFVLIRYISVAVLVISNVGCFSHSFGEKSCQRYYMVPVVSINWVLALQMTVCQFILGLRCTSGNDPSKLMNWAFYVWAMLYGIATLGLSTYFLVKAGGSGLSSMTGLVRAMVADGLGYIALLTVTDTVNLILYRASSLSAQAAAATLGIAFVWITSQNIMIKTRDACMRSYKNY
ncbi:hypothetical protein DFS33DRAFT_1437390 [Desarmillaria ectypa]|nr:hypothetical protein DFS33DRAFT_1437390 [Desarmillaria ectypa]